MSIRSLLRHVGIGIADDQKIMVGDRVVDEGVPVRAVPTEAQQAERLKYISDRYTYHPPTEEQITKYGSLRTKVKELAFLIEEVCPDSEEKAAAFASLDLTLMNANASIARHT